MSTPAMNAVVLVAAGARPCTASEQTGSFCMHAQLPGFVLCPKCHQPDRQKSGWIQELREELPMV